GLMVQPRVGLQLEGARRRVRFCDTYIALALRAIGSNFMTNRIASGFIEYAKLWGVLAAIVALRFFSTSHVVPPAPPRVVRIATGGKGGAYYAFAQKYASSLARDGIRLEVVPTAGSLDNI